MYSKLIFNFADYDIEFSASEIILIAQQVLKEIMGENNSTIEVPSCEDTEQELNKVFGGIFSCFITYLSEEYNIPGQEIADFINDILKNPLLIPKHTKLLRAIDSKPKQAKFSVPIRGDVVLPMRPISPNNISAWINVAKQLANTYSAQKHRAGWWFNIGGRIIRVRNDAGKKDFKNKQFYAADHGSYEKISKNTLKNISDIIGFLCRNQVIDDYIFALHKFHEFFDVKNSDDETGAMHQRNILLEFTAFMTDEIAIDVSKCQLLLISLAQSMKGFRGTTDKDKFNTSIYRNTGGRGIVKEPDKVDVASLHKYSTLFDNTIEQIRYLNKELLNEIVQNSVLFTQLKRIAHSEEAFIVMVSFVLLQLAKKINLGQHSPFPRELNAYGNRDDGDSYHKFAANIRKYFKQDNALSQQELAAQMRDMLNGAVIDDENLAFLPCLTAAWFISETARNPMTTLTSLILLDMLESGQELLENGKNWYAWEHVLMHPEKNSGAKKATTVLGKKVNIDEFGGCHPMAHSGSFKQTEFPLNPREVLNVARQKEANLIIHWLQIRCSMLNTEKKEKLGLKNTHAEAGTHGNTTDSSQSLTEIHGKIKQLKDRIDKLKTTIKIKQKANASTDISKQETAIEQFTNELKELEENLKSKEKAETAKESIKTKLIVPLLRARLSTFNNLIKPVKRDIKLPVHPKYINNTFGMDVSSDIHQKVLKNMYAILAKINPLDNINKNMSYFFHAIFDIYQQNMGVGGLLLQSFYQDEESILRESRQLAESQQEIGPPAIPGWNLQDVPGDGNCFYYAIIDQMRLINHSFLNTILEGTEAIDVLRLRLQGNHNFRDGEWANDEIINAFNSEFPDIVLAIADTRYPERGFQLRYVHNETPITHTDINDGTPEHLNANRNTIIRIAATGNHFLSVRAHPTLQNGALRGAFNAPHIHAEVQQKKYWDNFSGYPILPMFKREVALVKEGLSLPIKLKPETMREIFLALVALKKMNPGTKPKI